MAGGGLQAATHPAGGLWVVGCPALAQQASPSKFYAYHWCLQLQGLLGHEARENPGLSLGITGLYWRICGPNRHSLQLCVRTPKMYGPLDDPQWGQHSGGLPLKTHRRGTWNLSHTRGRSHSPEKGSQAARGPRFSPKSPFVEPAKWITAPSASPSLSPILQPSHHPSGKAKKSHQGIEANPNSPGRWACFYLQKHDRVPEWWREFWSLLCSTDKCLGNIQVLGLAHQQATAFRLPATQWEKDSLWTAPPCLRCWGEGTTFPWKTSRELEIIK